MTNLKYKRNRAESDALWYSNLQARMDAPKQETKRPMARIIILADYRKPEDKR